MNIYDAAGSIVLLPIVSGAGNVAGAQGERSVKVHDIVVYDPREPRGMRAASEQLVIAAAIVPRPGSTRRGV